MSRERKELGEVVSLQGRTAQVKKKRSSQCSSCSCAGLCSPFGKDWMMVTARNDLGAAIGQTVRISYHVEGEVKASFILYIIPLLALLVGAGVGTSIKLFNNPDFSAVIVGLSCMAISFVLIKKYAAWKYGREKTYHPVITEIVSNSQP
jgi:sigma-E factor negative regulatory protein RseC